ncbi:uncharacterized protein [Leptinotarsa decemlineata]|uniref:uncharacterized protein n=1 Tax=Leptinotarsa decemlineata TaxID=7539 RepID=UPI003D30AA86
MVNISDELSTKGIKWKFNCPAAPSMGGIWVRIVRSIKTALKVSLKEVNPKEEVLLTLPYKARYMVNSRPLAHISVDPSDPEAITPNQFWLLRPGGVQSYEGCPIKSRKQWRFSQALADIYWKRWVKEYRPTLIQRQKWHRKTAPIKVGDIAITVDDKAPRNNWLMGRVEETFSGKDGTIGIARVKTKNGLYIRPVSKLCEEYRASQGGECRIYFFVNCIYLF